MPPSTEHVDHTILGRFESLGITLHKSLISYDIRKPSAIAPTPILHAILQATYAKRRHSDTDLATPGYHPDFHPDDADPAFNMLASLVLKNYEPSKTSNKPAYYIDDLPPETRMNYCSDAERHFSRLFALMEVGAKKLPLRFGRVNPNYQIITTPGDNGHPNVPIMLRKASGDASAIALQRVIIDGIDVPPGGLVAIRLADEDENELSQNWIRGLTEIEVVDTTQIAAASPLRLTPWAYAPGIRTEFANRILARRNIPPSSPEHKQILHATLGDIALIASTQMKVYQ